MDVAESRNSDAKDDLYASLSATYRTLCSSVVNKSKNSDRDDRDTILPAKFSPITLINGKSLNLETIAIDCNLLQVYIFSKMPLHKARKGAAPISGKQTWNDKIG